MSRIQVLPETLAHQIAAGEVVERPASVLKELIENSIDAQSTRIEIALRGGGRQRVRVRDDGAGMDRSDVQLAFARHATSKICQIEDLSQIRTLGFRGEALPSIASVSRLTLKSRSKEEPGASGTEIVLEGGKVCSIREMGWPEGTEVDVQDLFFNVPARKKFIKAPSTELSHSMRLVAQYAIVHPEIYFEVENEQGMLFSVPPVASVHERIFQIYGKEFVDNLVPFEETRGTVRVHGFTSLPHEQRTNRYSQFFFVNGRMVRDKIISSAVAAAYRQLIPAGAFPVVLLFVEIPANEIDINVHPAKTEIRFRDSSAIFGLIRTAIDNGLLMRRPVPEYPRDSIFVPSSVEGGPHPLTFGPFASRSENQVALDYQAPVWGAAVAGRGDAAAGPEVRNVQIPEDHLSWPGMAFQPMSDVRSSEPPRAMGQFLNSFIIASDRYGLFVVDQHVAHERVLYDQSLRAMGSREVPAQRLLVPHTVAVAASRRALLPCVLPELNASGFEAQAYGDDIVIQAVPAIAKDTDVKLIVKEILEGLEVSERKLDVAELRKKIAVSMACHAAIKINTPLTTEKMQWLLDALYQTENPTSCPHGRPVLFRLGLYEILRNFKRI